MVEGFGISLGVSPRESLRQVGEFARTMEASGFDALWYIDHQLGMKDVYATLNVVALNTERVRIGAGVTNFETRHPTVTANATVALDELSDGRALLGLGAGWVAVHSIGRRPTNLAEIRAGIELCRTLFAGEETEWDGARVRLATAARPIPIYLAASQPRMLTLCGELCDGVVLMGAADPEFCAWQLAYIHEGLERAGRDRSEFTVDLFVTASIQDDQEQALADVRAWATSQAAAFKAWQRMPPAWERFRPEFQRAAEAYRYDDHLSLRAEHKQVVSEEFVRSVAVAGDAQHCTERLREVAALDIDRITFALLSGGRRRRLEQLATEVIPRLRGE